MIAHVIAYTSITGNYDNLREAKVPGRFVCFSDRPRRALGWEVQPFPQVFGTAHHRNSRIPKMLPHLLMDTVYSIYMDGAFSLNVGTDKILEFLGDADIALFHHPTNKSIHDERNFYQNCHGFIPEDIEAEYLKYLALNLPITGQFYAGGFIVRRHNDRVATFNELWMRKFLEGSNNDQFSLYYAVQQSGVSVAIIPGWIEGTQPAINYHLHAATDIGDNLNFASENEMWKQRIERIREICQ
jgi:hypothetical protein